MFDQTVTRFMDRSLEQLREAVAIMQVIGHAVRPAILTIVDLHRQRADAAQRGALAAERQAEAVRRQADAAERQAEAAERQAAADERRAMLDEARTNTLVQSVDEARAMLEQVMKAKP